MAYVCLQIKPFQIAKVTCMNVWMPQEASEFNKRKSGRVQRFTVENI